MSAKLLQKLRLGPSGFVGRFPMVEGQNSTAANILQAHTINVKKGQIPFRKTGEKTLEAHLTPNPINSLKS